MGKLKQTLEKDIYKIIKELKKCTNKERFYRLVNSCNDLTTIAFLEDIDLEIPKELDFELNKYNIDAIDEKYTNFLFDNINTMYSYNKKLCKMLDYLSYDDYYNKYFHSTISFSNSMELAKKFFKSFDKSLYDFYNKITGSNRFFTTNQLNDNLGLTYRSNDTIKSYISITPYNDITDFLSIVHEVSHAYIFEKQRYISPQEQCRDSINNFQEVYPFFIELIAMIFLKNINYNKEEINCLKDINDAALVANLTDFEEELYNDFRYQLYVKGEAYAYGSVLAYNFYNQYYNDKEIAKENVLNFMLESKNHNKFYMLDNYGLNKNDIINSQKLKKYMKIHKKELGL